MAEKTVAEIRENIRKLLAMATHERSNEHEAETAMRMANRLMTQHGIDAAELEDQTGVKPAYDWTATTIPVGERAKPMSWFPQWAGFLCMGVAKFTDCKVQRTVNVDHGECIKFMGDVADVEYASWLFKLMRDYGYAESKSVAGRHRDTFLKAYALRLCGRMTALLAERNAAMKAAVTKTGTALMVIENKLALRDAEFGKQGHGRKSRVKFASDGFTQGRAAADKVNFNRPIGHTSQKALQ